MPRKQLLTTITTALALCALLAPRALAQDPPLTLEPAGAFRLGLARRLAPEVRFHAHVAGASGSLQNVNEDFLPGSVDAFFESLAAGRYPLVVRRSRGAAPAEVRTITGRPSARFEREAGSGEADRGRIGGFPKRMAGSAVGAAPVYVHVYPEAEAARPREGGGFTRDWFAEYWLFYPFDWTCSRILGRIGCKGEHRGDWEHTSFRARVASNAKGEVTGVTLVHGEFFAHGWSYRVEASRLRRAAGPGEAHGEHPRVYVAQGKHGSYHAPGELHDWVAGAISDHDDFFYGNGAAWRTWEGALVDIGPEAKAASPERFAPPGFQALLARSPGVEIATWLDFRGRWGPDLEGIGGLHWTSSPTGPYVKTSWGNEARAAQTFTRWRARWGKKLTLYAADDPRVVPVVPAPAPEIVAPTPR